jgi:hypothetical protein
MPLAFVVITRAIGVLSDRKTEIERLNEEIRQKDLEM